LSALVKSEDNTDTLLIRWRAGSRQAGDRLLARYVQRLTAFFRKRLGSDADELVQRTLLACAQSIRNFESRSSFRTFLFGIARNQYLMYRRAEAFSGHEAVTISTRPEEGPSQLAAVRQEHVILVMALRRVEPEFSIVLKKFYWEERSVEEIATELGIPVGTVKSRLSRGRAALKEDLMKTSLRDDVRRNALLELSNWFSKHEE
jgi:RNA polymerase sigma-70 factor (ECF subfamily)